MNEFLDRLKQRKLVQWAVAYVAAAFALLQALDIVAQRFAWPEGAVRGLIVALVFGFFVTIVLAWYHGERGAQRVTGTELLILALLLAIGGGLLWRMAQSPRETSLAVDSATPSAAAQTPAKSIAVLSFTDLSPGHDQEYFSDGMAEEILNALAKIKDLKVAGRTSSFYYKGRNEDLRAISKALGVANVLEGSVRKQGDKVRITAQLIRGDDGFHLWSDAFDGDLADVFELQERIARAIAEQLQLVLQGSQQQRLVPVATSNPEAYALYLEATAIFNRRDGTRFPEAMIKLGEAIRLDPHFARAESRLAALYLLAPDYQADASRTEAAAAMRKHANLALAIDPTLAEPHAALGLELFFERDYSAALKTFDRALALDSDDATTNLWLGDMLVATGYSTRGSASLDRALAREPLLPVASLWRAITYSWSGDQASAERLLRHATEAGLPSVGMGWAIVAAARGDRAEAKKQLAAGTGIYLKTFPEHTAEIFAQASFGDLEASAEALRRIDAYLAKPSQDLNGVVPYVLLRVGQHARAFDLVSSRLVSAPVMYIGLWGPEGHAARTSPQFAEFARRSGLAAFWDEQGNPDQCRKNTAIDYVCN